MPISPITSPIPELVAELAAGRMVSLVDEEDRENEGDLVLAADHVVTPRTDGDRDQSSRLQPSSTHGPRCVAFLG